MKSNRTQKDIDQFFESFKQLPEYYSLEKVHQLINNSDAHVFESRKSNFKPLNFILMATLFTATLLTLLFWSPLLNNNETKIAPTKNNTSTDLPIADHVKKKHRPAPIFDKSITSKNQSSGQKQGPHKEDNTGGLQEKSKTSSKTNTGKHKNTAVMKLKTPVGDTLELAEVPAAVDHNAGKNVVDKKNHKRSAVKPRPANLLNGINFIELSPKELLTLGFTIQEKEINYIMKSNTDIVQVMLYNSEGQGVRLFEDSTINGNIHKIVFLSNIYGKQNVKWKDPEDPKDKWEVTYFQEKIQFLIPIVLRKNAFPEILYQDQIFWFEPTEAFLNNLPKEISTPLKSEYNYLTASKTDIKVKSNESCTYFEACRSSLPLNDLKLYPNPAHHTTTIKFHSLKDFTGTISLLNINGDLVRELIPSTTFLSNYSNTYKLDLSGISAGMYLISIITDKGFKTQRLIVQ